MLPNGMIKHLNDWRFITFGEQNGAMTERLGAVKALFDRTSVVATAVPNILAGMWEKLVQLATVAGATSVMRANVGEIARTDEGLALMNELFDTNAEIARRAGFAPSAAFLDDYRATLDRKSTSTASMLRDIEGKGQIETDHVIG
jgi:2-dehydropantoate 2-reductase